MHLASIDRMANNGGSVLHQAKAVYKIIFSFVVLTLIIFCENAVKMSGLILFLIGLFCLARVSPGEIVHLALYPVFFSLLFALFRIQHSWIDGVLVVLKALASALSMLLLITTTSYVEVFGFFSLFLPAVLVDIFLVTYRSFFILLDRIENIMKSMRLRGGYHFFRVLLNIKNIAGAVGVLILHSFDMSERMYRIYSLRGYNGKIIFSNKWFPLSLSDLIVLLMTSVIIVWMVIPWNLL